MILTQASTNLAICIVEDVQFSLLPYRRDHTPELSAKPPLPCFLNFYYIFKSISHIKNNSVILTLCKVVPHCIYHNTNCVLYVSMLKM